VAGAITLAKSARPGSYDAAGQVITFDYLVTNTSDVPMSSITVNDTSLPGLSPVACPQPDLGPGESEDCFATYTVTPADLDAGSVTNTATAQGNPPGSATPVVSGPATATVPAVPNPAIRVVKSASPVTFNHVGQPIAYSYLVINTGNVTLTGPIPDAKSASEII
jgi:uncharacterized repeat protein (TIGR01451 family)